jgi:hypothetical protein
MLLAAAGVAAFLLLRHTGSGRDSQAKAPVVAPLKAIPLVAAKDFDPPPDGDGIEHAGEVGNAIDGDRGTTWSTEIYTGGVLNKPGVGLYVTAGSSVAARKLEVFSPTPGFTAKVYAAPSPATDLAGWGQPVGKLKGAKKQTVALHTDGQRYRSYLIWIDKVPPGGQVKLSEVRLLG